MTDDQLIREIARELTYLYERLIPAPRTGNDWMRLVWLTITAATQIGMLVIEGQIVKDRQRGRWN